jgi:antitoxin HigA-1
MPERKQKIVRDPNRPRVHPGAIIREDVIPYINMTKSEFAKALGISRQMLHGILSEKYPVTAEMAVRLGHVIGNGPDIWLNLQKAYDLWHAQRSVDTSKLTRVKAAKAA